MHYDWYGIFQGGMIPLTPDSEDETYNCIRQLYVRACVRLLMPKKNRGWDPIVKLFMYILVFMHVCMYVCMYVRMYIYLIYLFISPLAW